MIMTVDSFTDEWGDGFGQETFVYRLHSAEMVVYVGHTHNLERRIKGHRRSSWWFREVVAIDAAAYSSRTAAQVAERWAIYDLQPRFNFRSRRVMPQGRRPDPLRAVDVSVLILGLA